MNSIAGWLGATVVAVGVAVYPQKSSAEAFTGAVFLEWSDAQQRSYIDAQLVMASSIVARDKPAMSQCMADRFYGIEGVSDAGFKEIRTTIKAYKTYHPSSVLVIVIENTCGAFY